MNYFSTHPATTLLQRPYAPQITTRWWLLAIVATTMLLCGCGVEDGSEGSSFGLQEVAPGIYVHQGRHVNPETPGRDDVANIGFIIGEQCVAVIDTGGSYTIGLELLHAIRHTTDVPVCYVINTHIHYDHVLGNTAFKSDAITFIGHSNLKGDLLRNLEFFRTEFSEEAGPEFTLDNFPLPALDVEDELTIDLGGRNLVLTAHPPAHSHDDLSVYDQNTGTLWLSDLLFMERVPVLDGNLKNWIRVMENLPSEQASVVIPGHGPVSARLPEALYGQTRYLTQLLNATRQMIATGIFLEEAIATAEQDAAEERKNWLLYDYYNGRNVSKAYTELEWE